MRAATGNQCNFVRRGVTCALNCRGLTEPGEHYNSPVWIEQVLGQRDSVEGPDPPNVVQGKPAGPGSSGNVVCEFQLIINYNPKVPS